MRFAIVFSAIAALLATTVSAQSVDAVGAQTERQPVRMIRIATRDVLNRATALLNKNTLMSDNNAFIARSNVVFLQNDRLRMRRRVMDALQHMADELPKNMATAVLAKSMLRAVSAPTTVATLMTKATAVVGAASRARDSDRNRDATAAMLVQRIIDFVDAVGMHEVEQEDAIRAQAPSGVRVLVGTKDMLRQPGSKTTIAASVRDAEPMYRVAIVYPINREADMDKGENSQEQWGFWGAGFGLGWRYPLGYWNRFGAGFYGGGCGLGFARGRFFFC